MYDVPALDQITVQSGDFLGLHYLVASDPTIIAWIHLVMTAAEPVSYGLTISDLSKYQVDAKYDASMPVGLELSVVIVNSNIVKLPALRAYVTPVEVSTRSTCLIITQHMTQFPLISLSIIWNLIYLLKDSDLNILQPLCLPSAEN